MKKILAVFVVGILVCGIAFAQDAPAGSQAGAKSLNFTFGGLGAFGLNGTGPAGGLGITYFLASNAAVRLGLQVAITSATTPSAITGNSDAEFSTFDAGVGVDYLMYMSGGRVKPYMGAGVVVGLASSNSKPSNPSPVPVGNTVETTNVRTGDGFGLSVVGIVGAEFYLYNDISLSAEYTLGLVEMISGADSETSIQGAPSVTSKGSSMLNLFGFGAAGATVHIYL